MVTKPPASDGRGSGKRKRPGHPEAPTPPDGRPASDGSAISACRDVVGRALLVPYALSRCPEEQALAFEGHLLTCEACFQDLKVLDRAGVLLRECAGSGQLDLGVLARDARATARQGDAAPRARIRRAAGPS